MSTREAWIKKHRESLLSEYHEYAWRHDYDHDGPMPFDVWARRQWAIEMEFQAWDRARSESA